MEIKNHQPAGRRSIILCGYTVLLYFYLGSNKPHQREIALKEYTLLAALSVLVTIIIDHQSGVRILRQKLYYLFFAVIIGFKLLVNGYLTRHIVMYNPEFFMGIRIGTIPLEDFLFGFSMVTISIVCWEYFKKSGR